MADAIGCATALVAQLLAHGVTDVVLAPGSRSAPLAYAVYAADSARRLRLHVRVDERTAGFLALGLAKASGRPVPVVTTSGTAAANLHPAVLEAHHGHLPLLVVTADRPRGLHHTGANQTTPQADLFTSHVRARAQLSDLDGEPTTWRHEVNRLVAMATGVRTRLPGPVHLDVELAGPLAPVGDVLLPEVGVPSVANSAPGPVHRLAPGGRTVVLVGDADSATGRRAAEFAVTAGLPLLAEPSSHARGAHALSTGRLLLAGPLAETIERVVVFGHPTLARSVTALLARPDVEVVIVTSYADWPDPGRRARLVVDDVDVGEPAAPHWLAAWQQADRRLAARLADLLGDRTGLTGPGLAAALWRSLGAADVLVVGASNPIRDLDLAPARPDPPAVYANRGLSGIDGTISTAVGIALALGRPVHALLGDLTAAHDLTGLLIGPAEPRPDLRLIVANDGGGSIFATLEHGEPGRAEAYERIFATPTGLDFAALATAVGVGYRCINDPAGLADALAHPPAGLEIVEAVIDRAGRRALDQAITALAATP